MANLTSFPSSITAGDSFSWRFERSGYSPADSWTSSALLLNATNSYEVTGVADGDGFDFEVLSPESVLWAPGQYSAFEIYTLSPDNRLSIELSSLTVEPNPTSGPYDTRSLARQMLDAIDAILLGRATGDDLDLVRAQARSRHVERDATLLQSMRTYWKNQVDAEKQVDRIRAGKGAGNKIVIQFPRP